MQLKGRHFLTLKDFTREEILYFIDLAEHLKKLKKQGIPVDVLRGKNVALIFEKTSTRTRSFSRSTARPDSSPRPGARTRECTRRLDARSP